MGSHAQPDNAERGPRQPQLRLDDLSASERRLYDAIRSGPRGLVDLTDGSGAVKESVASLFLSPDIGDALQRLGAALRFQSQLTPRLRELAILAVVTHLRNEPERTAHETIAHSVGISEDELVAIRQSAIPDTSDPHEAAGLRLIHSLLGGDVDDATWASCSPPLDATVVFELVAVVGYYSTTTLLSRALRTK